MPVGFGYLKTLGLPQWWSPLPELLPNTSLLHASASIWFQTWRAGEGPRVRRRQCAEGTCVPNHPRICPTPSTNYMDKKKPVTRETWFHFVAYSFIFCCPQDETRHQRPWLLQANTSSSSGPKAARWPTFLPGPCYSNRGGPTGSGAKSKERSGALGNAPCLSRKGPWRCDVKLPSQTPWEGCSPIWGHL